MKILGIDPGTTRIGYGFIKSSNTLTMLACGLIEVQAKTHQARILELGKRFIELIQELQPDIAGVESLYFSKNQKTALSVSEARGILLHLLLQQNVSIFECRPQEVKLAVTGYGAADKKMVAKMVKKTLGVDSIPGHDDITDALAIAITTAGKYKIEKTLGGV
jgi:crossover junction endodeoxyribonuclease RuvC